MTGKYIRVNFIFSELKLLSKITLFSGNVKAQIFLQHLLFFVHIAYDETKTDLFYC